MFLTQNFYGPGIECALARITAYFTNNMKVKDFIRSQGTLLSAPPPSSKKKKLRVYFIHYYEGSSDLPLWQSEKEILTDPPH